MSWILNLYGGVELNNDIVLSLVEDDSRLFDSSSSIANSTAADLSGQGLLSVYPVVSTG